MGGWIEKSNDCSFAARVVAMLEVILAVINVLGMTATFGIALHLWTLNDYVQLQNVEQIVEHRFGVDMFTFQLTLWIGIAIMGVPIIVSAVAAFMLLKATETGIDPKEALWKAKFWRGVRIGFMVLEVLICGIPFRLFYVLGGVLAFRVFGLLTVEHYIRKLEITKKAMERGVQYQSKASSTDDDDAPPAYEYVGQQKV